MDDPQLHSFEFTVMRVLMKLFATSSVDVVNTSLIYFNVLPIRMQILLRTARFLQKFSASENVLCSLFHTTADEQLTVILSQYSAETACQCLTRCTCVSNSHCQLLFSLFYCFHYNFFMMIFYYGF